MPPFLFPAGAGVVANAQAPSPDYFRVLDGVTWNDAYPFGTRVESITSTPGDVLHATPAFTAAATRIADIAFFCALVGGTPKNAKLGIYSNKGATDPFPLTLLWSSGIVTPAAGLNIVPVNLTVTQNTLLWVANNMEAGASQTMHQTDVSNSANANPYGFPESASWVSFNSQYAVNVALAFASAFPATFPTAGATIVGSGSIAWRFLWRGT